MQKFLQWLGIRRYSVKEFCMISMLVALTAFLSVYTTFYPAPWLKISFKFVSVFVSGTLFGPLIAAMISLFGDILSATMASSMTPLPTIMFAEFIAGFIYGGCFHNQKKLSKSYVIRLVICVLLQLVLDVFLTTYFLSQAGYAPGNYMAAIISRLPASFVKLVLQTSVILIFSRYLSIFSKFIKK